MARHIRPSSERKERARQSDRELFRSARNPFEVGELLKDFVFDHVAERLDVLAKFLVLVEELRKNNKLSSSTTVAHTGAYWQEFKGSDGFIATHLMHCQITLGGKRPDRLLPNSPRYVAEIEKLFGACTHQPGWVNIADIVLESNGARNQLVEATRSVLRGELLTAVFDFFLDRYRTLLDSCIAKKEPLAGVPLEVLMQRGELESVPHSLSDSMRDERVKTVLEYMRNRLPVAAGFVRGWFPAAITYRQRMASENWF
jgi:hypothetical protein